MLKRAWLVVSIPWTLFFALFLSDAAFPEAVLFFMALPWVVGPLVVWAVRFIVTGTVVKAKKEPKVSATWAD